LVFIANPGINGNWNLKTPSVFFFFFFESAFITHSMYVSTKMCADWVGSLIGWSIVL